MEDKVKVKLGASKNLRRGLISGKFRQQVFYDLYMYNLNV